MTMLKEERKKFRDELEREYGIHLREDDELLPIIQFIKEATALTVFNASESKNVLEEIRINSEKNFANHSHEFKGLLLKAVNILSGAATESRSLISLAKRDLDGLPKMVKDFKDSVTELKIPEHVTINRISFEDRTMSFLWKYFTFSTAAIAIIIFLSGWWIYGINSEIHEMKSKYKPNEHEWLLKYYNQMRVEAPALTQKFIEENRMPAED